jgi:AraC family transcriptional regulator
MEAHSAAPTTRRRDFTASLGISTGSSVSQGERAFTFDNTPHPAAAHAVPLSRAVRQLAEVSESPRGLVASSLKADRPRGSGDARGGLTPWQQRRLEVFVAAHLGDAICVNDPAGEVSLSVGHFCRAFRESFGRPPYAYIVRCRMELAQQLILKTDERLSHIAVLSGLADQAHLTRLFRRATGSTPGHWRRCNRCRCPAGSYRDDGVDAA